MFLHSGNLQRIKCLQMRSDRAGGRYQADCAFQTNANQRQRVRLFYHNMSLQDLGDWAPKLALRV